MESIQTWWREFGRRNYPDADHLLTLADCGGSNIYKARPWKLKLRQNVANRFGINVTVTHYHQRHQNGTLSNTGCFLHKQELGGSAAGKL
ncbi:MAG: hypothetical protein GX230_06575 [Lentisphaerae bacterium]|nr:hypothetical protein [Lentisphaerota bacterium]